MKKAMIYPNFVCLAIVLVNLLAISHTCLRGASFHHMNIKWSTSAKNSPGTATISGDYEEVGYIDNHNT